ncbi:MAG: SixA phosphatase family protein [Pyrinomonadaceae bacterium]
MKRLLLLRHAKSSWGDSNLADFDRPLNSRGVVAAPFMGELMAERGLIPDAIVSSPAKRAEQTATLVKENGGLNAPLSFDDRIYEASPQSLLYVASNLDDDLQCVMLVGHNPGMEGFIGFLTKTVEPMPTAALAIIDLDIKKWSQIAFGTGSLETVIRPRDEMK